MRDTRELFDRYAVALSTSNIDDITKCYNSSFIMSSAFGTQSVDNDDKFRSNLEHALLVFTSKSVWNQWTSPSTRNQC